MYNQTTYLKVTKFLDSFNYMRLILFLNLYLFCSKRKRAYLPGCNSFLVEHLCSCKRSKENAQCQRIFNRKDFSVNLLHIPEKVYRFFFLSPQFNNAICYIYAGDTPLTLQSFIKLSIPDVLGAEASACL